MSVRPCINTHVAEAWRLASAGQPYGHLLRQLEAALRARYDEARTAQVIGGIITGCTTCRYSLEERGALCCRLAYDEETDSFASTAVMRFKHDQISSILIMEGRDAAPVAPPIIASGRLVHQP